MSLVVALLYMRVSLDALNNVARREVLSCPNSNLVQKKRSCCKRYRSPWVSRQNAATLWAKGAVYIKLTKWSESGFLALHLSVVPCIQLEARMKFNS